MKKIVFGRRPKVYLPEISAYINYINNNIEGWTGYDSKDLENYNPDDFDVVWRFMGFDFKGRGRHVVHEYNSLSAGAFPHLKNRIKSLCNCKPDRRVFLSRAVESHFTFNDDVPKTKRDMGVDQRFFMYGDEVFPDKEYDFVYAGSIKDRGYIVIEALEHFKSNMKDTKILVVGAASDEVMKQFSDAPNVTFTGRVAYEEVPRLISKAEYGLNLMPDIYPFNAQTATKVIEYCALGLKIVSSDYKWARRFERKRKGNFFFIKDDLSNLSSQSIQNYNFHTPKVGDLEWNALIRSSGVFNFLKDL